MPAAALASLRGLRTLDLGKNGITDLSLDAEKPSAADNGVGNLSPAVAAARDPSTSAGSGGGLSGLIGLKLDYNEISEVSVASLAQLSNLQILNLAGNKIR